MRMSKAKRETIRTSAVLLVLIVLVLLFLVYPLNKVGTYFGRADGNPIPVDTLPPNDPSAWVAADRQVDTFRIEADGMTKLAELEITRPGVPPSGTVILVPNVDQSRDELVSYVAPLLDGAARVIVYDQRGSGLSSGEYHGDGQLEAADLQAVIAELSIHGRLTEPLAVIGFGVGGDAALLAAHEEPRISSITAVNPYLTTANYIDSRIAQRGGMWLPFRRTLLWWWYQMRTGTGESARELDDLRPVAVPTAVFLSREMPQAALEKLRTLSPGKLTASEWPADTMIRPALVAASVLPFTPQAQDRAEPAP